VLQDLEVYIVQGGYIPLKENGICPPYLYFTSKSIALRTSNRKIINGTSKGYVSKDKKKLFYFKYTESTQECLVYPIIGTERSDNFFIPDCSILLVD
jgi:hypothetical protein